MVENTLHLGLCLPKSCSSDQIHSLVQSFFNDPAKAYEFGLQSNVLRVKDLKIHPQFFLKKTVLGFLLVTIAVAYLRRVAAKKKKRPMTDSNNNVVETEDDFQLNQKLEIQKGNFAAATIGSISGLRYVSLAQAGKFQNNTCFQIHFMLLNCNYARLSFLSFFAV